MVHCSMRMAKEPEDITDKALHLLIYTRIVQKGWAAFRQELLQRVAGE